MDGWIDGWFLYCIGNIKLLGKQNDFYCTVNLNYIFSVFIKKKIKVNFFKATPTSIDSMNFFTTEV